MRQNKPRIHFPHGIPAIVLGTLLASAVGAGAQMDANTIIQRSVAANQADWKAAPLYDHYERDRSDDGGSKTYDVLMIDGSPYQELVAINGKPLSQQQQAAEESKLQQTVSQREHETPEQRAQRIAKYERDRKRDQLLMDQLTEAFNFKLIGQQKLNGFDVYVLSATARPGYRPPNTETQVLTGMEGKLWVDKNSFQWVKVEAHVIHPVSIEGFLARVQPGTRFELEKMPVNDNIWLPTHFSMRAQAKVLFLFNHKSADDEHYWGYQKVAPISAANRQPSR
jgi:hypothetical protein